MKKQTQDAPKRLILKKRTIVRLNEEMLSRLNLANQNTTIETKDPRDPDCPSYTCFMCQSEPNCKTFTC